MNILIIDNCRQNENKIQKFLLDSNQEHIHYVNETNDAIDLLESENYDFIILDIKNNNPKSIDILNYISSHNFHIPVILSSCCNNLNKNLVKDNLLSEIDLQKLNIQSLEDLYLKSKSFRPYIKLISKLTNFMHKKQQKKEELSLILNGLNNNLKGIKN